MKIRMTVIASACLLFVWSFTIEAQVVQKPAFQPGDWWELTIKTTDATHHEPFYQLDGEYRIEAVDAGFKCTYKDAGKWTDNCGEAKGIILNALLGIGEEKYLNFPMTAGNKWKYSFPDSEGRDFSGESALVKSEKITVAAKKFDAYRIKRKGSWTSMSGHHSGPVSVLYWYALGCKCIPKLKLQSSGHSYGSALMEMKITNYKVAD